MSSDDADDFSNRSLLDLFRMEAESQAQVLNEGLLALEHNATDLASVEPLMRAAHSLKGAARIVGLDPIERLAHVMEDCFVAAQKKRLVLTRTHIDRLLAGADLISELAAQPDEAGSAAWLQINEVRIADLLVSLYEASDPDASNNAVTAPVPKSAPVPASAPTGPVPPTPVASRVAAPIARAAQTPLEMQGKEVHKGDASGASDIPVEVRAEMPRDESVLRVNVRRFDRLLALSSESRVASRALQPQVQALQRFRRKQQEAFSVFDQTLALVQGNERLDAELATIRQKFGALENLLVRQLAELGSYERRTQSLAQDLLDEVLDLRMRPFRDGVLAFPRMVRDLARELGKEARLSIAGESTLVDRDVLAQMEAPLNQILRNALDHGMESPEQRTAAGKPARGTITLEARHHAGMLQIQVSDDGRGLEPDVIRRALVARGMSSTEMAATMSTAELLDFLLLPGFSLKDSAGPISGRGVGLDVVAASVRRLNGNVRLETRPQQGFRVLITLPLSQSLIPALVMTVAEEMLALPIARIERVLRVPTTDVHTLADRQFFSFDDAHIDLIALAQLLELGQAAPHTDQLSVVIIGKERQRYGLVVDTIVGEQSLAARPLNPAFGKVRDVAAAALLDDGVPVLILDSADLLQSIEKLAGEGGLKRLAYTQADSRAAVKRVLVVDDSLTVREMERKLLAARGFDVDLCVDGMDGWNAVRSQRYDLVITDVDMPRMDGIELVSLIKKDERLRNLPVMIVSYKDRPEDRARGIDAGADYYLAKGSFHDETLLEAVIDLIGESSP